MSEKRLWLLWRRDFSLLIELFGPSSKSRTFSVPGTGMESSLQREDLYNLPPVQFFWFWQRPKIPKEEKFFFFLFNIKSPSSSLIFFIFSTPPGVFFGALQLRDFDESESTKGSVVRPTERTFFPQLSLFYYLVKVLSGSSSLLTDEW